MKVVSHSAVAGRKGAAQLAEAARSDRNAEEKPMETFIFPTFFISIRNLILEHGEDCTSI